IYLHGYCNRSGQCGSCSALSERHRSAQRCRYCFHHCGSDRQWIERRLRHSVAGGVSKFIYLR
ncbi:MAG: hypothetical protein ACK55I_51480, partial [bacterium]